MTDPADLPESDRLPGAPHPRETARLIGQAAAEAEFLKAHGSGRLHHGWLLTGPRGVGKATLAWRIARFLLAEQKAEAGLFGAPPPPGSLDTDPDNPVVRRMAQLAEPRLFLLRRAWDEEKKRLKTVITVDEVRRLRSFFQLSATEGGRRVAIVDAADEMNPNAANALLKILEEPPPGAVLLLIAHQPARLLPTIRSRCRVLRLSPLGPDDLAAALAATGTETAAAPGLAALAAGSVGEAIRLADRGGLELYARIVDMAADLPRLDRAKMRALADAAAQRGAEDRLDLILTLIDLFLTRLARAGAMAPTGPEAAPGEAALLARLCPDQTAARAWADLAQALSARSRAGAAVNLDPAALVIDMVLRIDETAARIARRG